MHSDNFYSVDRLVEFGMGVGIAQQMVKSMNHVIANTIVPGAMNPMGSPSARAAFHVILDGKPAGPFPELEVMRLITQGKVSAATYVWTPGMANWARGDAVPELLRLVALCPPPFKPGEPT
ncbi:DUF4339 domain-containing protein [Caenimonas koreensis]|nr:DUF4339 domain-containing protein [Caenimonas koreensis]